MSKLKLLVLDAGIVIQLHEYGLWQSFISRCEVSLSRTVAEDEAVFFEVNGERFEIDLTEDIRAARIKVFEVSLTEIRKFRQQFDGLYLGELDPGETESLAFLLAAPQRLVISSGDAIVFRVLGLLGRGEQGLSLEEILQRIGLQRPDLPWSCSQRFREKYTQQGVVDGIQGRGLEQRKRR